MNKELFRYIENEMSEEEKVLFEIKLKNSAELMEEFKKFNQLKELSNINVNEDYLNSIIPSFRSKLAREKKSIFNVKISTAIVSLASVILIFFIIRGLQQNNKFDIHRAVVKTENIVKNMTNDEINESLAEINDQQAVVHKINKEISEDSSISKIIDDKFNKEIPVEEAVMASNENYDLIASSMNDDEANSVCNSIINKEFFER